MKTVTKSVLIRYSPAAIYRLVVDVEAYPQFLPWCDHTRILTQDNDGMVAEIGIALAGMHRKFTTRNRHWPDRQVEIALLKGPFSRLDGRWNFWPLNHGHACKVELTMSYGFESMLGRLVAPVFDKIANTMVDAFIRRAEQVYSGQTAFRIDDALTPRA